MGFKRSVENRLTTVENRQIVEILITIVGFASVIVKLIGVA